VAKAFSGKAPRESNHLDPVELDRLLRDTRRKLEAEYGTKELDYYVPPLRSRWKTEDLPAIKDSITVSDVRQAIDEIDRNGVPQNAVSTTYDLIEAGRRYPPKLVISLAVKYSSGVELDRGTFSGGEETTAFRLLRSLGFDIEPKVAIPDLAAKFLAQANVATELSVQGYLTEYRGLGVRVSFGQGNFARIPWIAFLAKGQTVSNGIYPVFLLFRSEKVLLLCYGLSETNEPIGSWGNLADTPTVQAWFNNRFGRNPDRYGASYVRAAYELDKPLPMEDIGRELDLMIEQYKKITGLSEAHQGNKVVVQNLDIRRDLGEAVQSFTDALRLSSVTFGEAQDDLVRSFIASLVTKPFVILTGLSGSGKTQIAIRLGEWLGRDRLHVAAVRPDWTGAEALFGYEDGLKAAVDGAAAWSVPAPLEFMLKAAEDHQYPYLLLLDEMNLAHVERYFADVLSGMESGQPCLPNLSKGDDGLWRHKAGGPPRIMYPRNLWIVGTVNVDETTYMFSPKVLDRANTFEFRVATSDLQTDVRRPVPCEPGDQALIRGLTAIASDDRWHHSNPATFQNLLAEKMKQLHQVLTHYGLEFGHRTFFETLRFAALAEAAGISTVEAVLDRVVIQKVLPRLHGSRRRLELPLLALAHFCRDLPGDVEADDKLPSMQLEQPFAGVVRLPISYDKLCRLLRNLRANQFASFTE
jgi:5-methylcytosine-specific restriction protein B